MSGSVLGYLGELYDPDLRATKVVTLGSAFVLMLFLVSPDFTNPYYVFGVAATVFALTGSIAILMFE